MIESDGENDYLKAGFIDRILGKTISGVVVKRSEDDNPRMQIHLIFSDGTNFEFYSQHEDIVPIKGLRFGGIDSINSYSIENIVYEKTIDKP